MKKIISGLFALGAVGLASWTHPAIQEPQEIKRDSSEFMMKKLDRSRDIVGGLAMEDYPTIKKAAQELMLLSHEADWNVITTQAFLQMSSEFRNSAGRLRDAAEDKNVDSATLAYFEVTLSCVRCHKYVRDEGKRHLGEGIRDRIRDDIKEHTKDK